MLTHNEVLNDCKLKILLLGIAFTVAIVGLVALIAPPNNLDSMSYHMPRIMHWIQDSSVENYPASFTPQLFLSPWVEFAILHLQLLSGSDHYANLIQWTAMIGSILGSSLIAKQLGAEQNGQVLSSVFCTTIPMGILQASSTKNDYVLAFWLTCMVYHILLTIKSKASKGKYWEIGLSLGLACLTKPTAYLYSSPFLVWLFLSKIKLLHWKSWIPFVQVFSLAFLINIFHFFRNIELFNHPLGLNPVNITYKNQIFGLKPLFSNIIRNIAINLSTPIPSANRFIIKFISEIHSLLNIDISDPRTSSSAFQLNSLINHEDLAGNQIHLLIIIISIVFIVIFRNDSKIIINYILKFYLLSVLSAFIIFCLVLAWTPFNTRLHLPLFVLSSAFVGCIFSYILSSRLISTLGCILLLLSFPYVLFNENRPIVFNSKIISGKVENIFSPRIDQYFITKPDLKDSYKSSINFLISQKCFKIGVAMNRDPFEYPLWVLLQESRLQSYQIQHVDVENESSKKYKTYPYNNFTPCVILDLQGSINELNKKYKPLEIPILSLN